MKQRAEITFEIEETIVHRAGSQIARAYCFGCAQEVLVAPSRVASLISGLSEREIFRRLEAGALHFFENEVLMICLNDLLASGQDAIVNIESDLPAMSGDRNR